MHLKILFLSENLRIIHWDISLDKMIKFEPEYILDSINDEAGNNHLSDIRKRYELLHQLSLFYHKSV